MFKGNMTSRLLVVGGGSAPIDSSIPMTTPGITAGLGALALNLTGQTGRSSPGATASAYGFASTSTKEFNWANERALEWRNYTIDFEICEYGILDNSFSKSANWQYDNSLGRWRAVINGSTEFTINGDSFDIVAIKIDGSGRCYFYIDGALQYTSVPVFSGGDLLYIFCGFNTGAIAVPASAYGQSEVISAPNQYAYAYGGADNWSGEAIAIP